MLNTKIKHIFVGILWLLAASAHAETIYVIDELKIGLHQDRTTDSPIMKLVPSGTALTVIERDNDLVHVQEPEGIRGWVNSKYVINTKPGKALTKELENKNKELQKEIALLKSKEPTISTTGDATAAQKDLEQQLKTERLKVGELQAQIADLKARIPNINNSEQFLADIEQLKQENKQLISQLESSGIKANTNSENGKLEYLSSWKNSVIILVIIFIIGLVVGAFILDYLNRRRHGGFRV